MDRPTGAIPRQWALLVKGWTLADLTDDVQYKMQQEAQKKLKHFAQEDGTVRFRAPAHIVTAAKL